MGLLWFVEAEASAGMARRNRAGFGIRENRLQFLFPASVPAGSITLFGIHGQRRLEMPLGPFGSGAHLVDLPKFAPGVYSLWIALGPYSGSAHLIHSGNRMILMQSIQPGFRSRPARRPA